MNRSKNGREPQNFEQFDVTFAENGDQVIPPYEPPDSYLTDYFQHSATIDDSTVTVKEIAESRHNANTVRGYNNA